MSTAARRYYLRGREALTAGDASGAAEALTSAVELAPTFTAARVALASSLARLGDLPRAIQVLRAGITRPCPRASLLHLWVTLGDVLVLQGDFRAAQDAYREAGSDPAFAGRVAAGRARMWARQRRFGDAFVELERAARTR